MTRNIAASVRQRLRNKAAEDERPFDEVLQYYAMERFLYRLSLSEHAERFVLKGALMLLVWRSATIRPTRDIDMLGITTNDIDVIISQIREVMEIEVEDGLIFDVSSIRAERITENADYEGVRVTFIGRLENARVTMQIDIGFGDVVHPSPIEIELPTILDFPAPRLKGYSRESTIAEKFEAMVKLGELNSRMKDFYDIWLLSRQFKFDQNILLSAIKQTFERRGTALPDSISAFSKGFAEDKQGQWRAFRVRLEQDQIPEDFLEITSAIEKFLRSIVTAMKNDFAS